MCARPLVQEFQRARPKVIQGERERENGNTLKLLRINCQTVSYRGDLFIILTGRVLKPKKKQDM